MILSPDELIKAISTTIGKTKVVTLSSILGQQHFALRDLIDITFNPDKNIAFRAAWILENLFLKNPESYLDDINYLFSRIREVTNESCKRHYAKIVMHITDPKAPPRIQQKLQETDLASTVEQLFDWMIDPKVKVAIKVFASRALFNMKDQYPWIAEELKNQIRFLMRNGSAGMQSRGRKLLSQL